MIHLKNIWFYISLPAYFLLTFVIEGTIQAIQLAQTAISDQKVWYRACKRYNRKEFH